MNAEQQQRIATNLAFVRERIAQAAERSGRKAEAVKLVAVSKYFDADFASALVAAGCRDLGEARPQDLWQKSEALSQLNPQWHLIGHLQTNKVRRTLPWVSLIHSIDSEKLLSTVNAEAATLGRQTKVLLEVNISGDAAKHGFSPDAIEPILLRAAEWPHVAIQGLMGMASLEGGATVTRRNFAALAQLRVRLLEQCPPEASLAELSMGMSHDFEAAIESGATIVRIGSALGVGLEA
jgi:pyridoxal phosphate enzyme (YggS family)